MPPEGDDPAGDPPGDAASDAAGDSGPAEAGNALEGQSSDTNAEDTPGNHFRRRRYLWVPVAVLVVAAVVVGLLSGTFASAARAGLRATGLISDGGASTLAPGQLSSPASANPTPTSSESSTSSANPSAPLPTIAPPPVLAVATPGPPPKKSRVDARIDAVDQSAMKGSYSGSVIDAGTGLVLYAKNADKGYLPASTMKLLTTTTALSVLGPQHRFATRVVAGRSGHVVLVGGGDPYLAASPDSALPGATSLSQLARLTATRLSEGRQLTVALDYDSSLFTGPAWHPDWPPMYRDQVSPVAALWVGEGRRFGRSGPRVAKPDLAAAEFFARALKKYGVRVTRVAEAKARHSATQLAAVSSLPLDRIVEHLLMVSDNDAAEVVYRQLALGAGKPGSFAGGRAEVRARLTKLGVFDDEARLRDGSGLSRMNRVPADLLTKVLRLDLQPSHPGLRGVITALPVAGVEGSLRSRFLDKASRSARGLVRGKTGTLTGVHALAGYVRSVDGSILVYAFLVNNPKSGFAAQSWLNDVTSAITSCGCR